MIETRDLGKRFSSRVVADDLSFRVAIGKILGFLGSNGVGKSTTIEMPTGFLTPSAGAASTFDFNIRSRTLRTQWLTGYLPEGSPCYTGMTMQGSPDFTAKTRGYRGVDERERIVRTLRLLGLDEARRQAIETFSKGFHQRIDLAQAILHEPRALILDEPINGLNPNQKRQVCELIRDLAQGRIVIISTHILEEVLVLCSRALMIGDGRLLADSTSLELTSHSRYRQVVALYNDSPLNTVVLAVLPGVADIKKNSAEGNLTVLAQPGAAIFPQVNGLATEHGWRIRELDMECGRFNEVFRNPTRGTEA